MVTLKQQVPMTTYRGIAPARTQLKEYRRQVSSQQIPSLVYSGQSSAEAEDIARINAEIKAAKERYAYVAKLS